MKNDENIDEAFFTLATKAMKEYKTTDIKMDQKLTQLHDDLKGSKSSKKNSC